jgi:hypothetical protein
MAASWHSILSDASDRCSPDDLVTTWGRLREVRLTLIVFLHLRTDPDDALYTVSGMVQPSPEAYPKL